MPSKQRGLTASEVEKLQKQYGLNLLPEAKAVPSWLIFLKQFKSTLVLLLLFAALVSFLLSELTNAFFIMMIVVLNAAVGFYQEVKAKKEIAALKKMVVATCRVIRNGREVLIETKDIVPGDLVIVEEGGKVPCDGVIVAGFNLTVSEAPLTGESAPVAKGEGDEVYLASTVLSGRGKMTAGKIGKETRFGKIALSLSEIKEEETPLEVKLSSFGQKITMLVIAIVIIIIGVGWLQNRNSESLFLTSVAIAVAAIPEGLPAVLTIALAVGAGRLAKRGAIIKRFVATEALGSVEVILTDKTGTLTKNEMTVVEMITVENHSYHVTGSGYSSDGKIVNYKKDESLAQMIKTALLANTSSLVPVEDGGKSFTVLGDTTEGALLILGKKAGVDYEEVRENNHLVEELSFDSQRRMMTVVTKDEILTKGAPEKVLEVSVNLTQKEREFFLQKVRDFGNRGYRVLALAHKKNNSRFGRAELEKNLNFLGLCAIHDASRPEVKEAVRFCRNLGVEVVMITGDLPQTSQTIAKEIGLLQKDQEIITGDQLKFYSDEVLQKNLTRIGVFARVSPADKLRIVEAYQSLGKIVAVTGDGVNDAPALKRAHIGVAMGKTGTDVAAEASDLVITDDNFTTIVAAIEEGRLIFANLTKAIKYLFASNLSEVLTVTTALFFGMPLPVSPLALLWLNVATDGLPALALATDGAVNQKSEILNPKHFGKSFLIKEDFWQIGIIGGIISLAALFTFALFLPSGEHTARLSVFTMLMFLQLMVAFAVRGKTQNIFANKRLICAVVFALVFQVVILSIPVFRERFI